MLYRLPDIISGVMAQPLYIEQGFSLAEIANVIKIYGVMDRHRRGLRGGLLRARFGLQPTLLAGGIAAAASNLMFSWLALGGHDTPLFVASISIDNFCGNFAGTALIAYMSSLTSSAFVATQYALLSSLYALPGKFVGGFSGYMVDDFGYPILLRGHRPAIGIPVVAPVHRARRARRGQGDAGAGGADTRGGGHRRQGVSGDPTRNQIGTRALPPATVLFPKTSERQPCETPP